LHHYFIFLKNGKDKNKAVEIKEICKLNFFGWMGVEFMGYLLAEVCSIKVKDK